MQIQEQVQTFSEFIYAMKHARTSPCFSMISMFLVKRFYRNRMRIGKDLDLDKTKIYSFKIGDEESFWLISGPHSDKSS